MSVNHTGEKKTRRANAVLTKVPLSDNIRQCNVLKLGFKNPTLKDTRRCANRSDSPLLSATCLSALLRSRPSFLSPLPLPSHRVLSPLLLSSLPSSLLFSPLISLLSLLSFLPIPLHVLSPLCLSLSRSSVSPLSSPPFSYMLLSLSSPSLCSAASFPLPSRCRTRKSTQARSRKSRSKAEHKEVGRGATRKGRKVLEGGGKGGGEGRRGGEETEGRGAGQAGARGGK